MLVMIVMGATAGAALAWPLSQPQPFRTSAVVIASLLALLLSP